jgi:hypothetical protein
MAVLRAHDISLKLGGGTGLARVIHLAEARALVQAHAQAPAAAASIDHFPADHEADPAAVQRPHTFRDAWASVDVMIPSGQDATHRLARVIAATAAAVRRQATPVRAVIRIPASMAAATSPAPVLIDDAGSLSISAIERRFTSASQAAGETHDAQLEVVDGSGLGVARLLAPAEGRVVVTIGSPTRRVMPCRLNDGQEVIAVSSILEVWVHGGGTLSAIETADLAGAVARAIGTVDRA